MKVRYGITLAAVAGLVASLAGIPSAATAAPTQPTGGASMTIEAEDFRESGFTDSTSANIGGQYRTTAVDIAAGGNGYYVGWTAPGEQLDYQLTLAQSGIYAAEFTLASNQTGRTLQIFLDDQPIAGVPTFDGRGWRTWGTIPVNLGQVSAGEHTLRLVFGNGKLDVDRFVLVNTTAPSYPGEPAPGDVHWGAFYRPTSGAADLGARYEEAAGQPLELHRAFFQWSQRSTSMVDTASEDIAAGRIPWVSTKTPSWTDMASGKYDAEIDQMLTALDALQGPVWLTIHHEPDGGEGINVPDDRSGPAGHLAMNQRVRDRMTALGVDNVALVLILMEWTFSSQSGRSVDPYWAPGVYDFFGVDTYAWNEGQGLLDATWQKVRTWAAERDMDIAVGEFGIRGGGTPPADKIRDFYQAAVESATDGLGARVIGLSVFDSGPKGWTLSEEQLAEFREILSEQ